MPQYRTDESNKTVICSSRKTTEQYKEELFQIHPSILPLEEYNGANTKISHKCKKCEYIWKTTPHILLRGANCPVCSGKILSKQLYYQRIQEYYPNIEILGEFINSATPILHKYKSCGHIVLNKPRNILEGKGCRICARISRRKTTETFIEEMKGVNSYIDIIGEYNDSNTKIKVQCKKCGFTFHTLPNNLLKGTGCPKCTNHYTMSHEEFLQRIKEVKNKNIEILSQYKNRKSPIQCKCKKCGHIWNTNLDRILQGNGCKKCSDIERAKIRTLSLDEVIERIHMRFPHIDIIGEYINVKENTTCKCNLCNNIWDTKISSLLYQKYGCPKCAIEINKKKNIKTHEKYVEEVLSKNPNLEILSKYEGVKNNITAKCLSCNRQWVTRALNLLRCGCPYCASSKLERLTEKYLQNNNIIFSKWTKFDNLLGIGNGKLSYDFYLPTYNLLIECQGEQHEHPVEYFGGIKKFVIQKIHDTRKRKYAHDHNIKLLEIWYYENNKIDKILEQTLNNLKSESLETVIPA